MLNLEVPFLYGTRQDGDNLGAYIQESHGTLSLKFPGELQRGMYGLQSFLVVRETSAPSLTIFVCKVTEFGGRNREMEGDREGEGTSAPVVKAFAFAFGHS